MGIVDIGPADIAGGDRGHGGSAGRCAALDARRFLRLRGQQMADHSSLCPPSCHARHLDGHDPGHRARGRRSRPLDAGRRHAGGPRFAHRYGGAVCSSRAQFHASGVSNLPRQPAESRLGRCQADGVYHHALADFDHHYSQCVRHLAAGALAAQIPGRPVLTGVAPMSVPSMQNPQAMTVPSTVPIAAPSANQAPPAVASSAGRLAAIERGETFMTETHEAVSREQAVLEVNKFCLFYGAKQALFNVNLAVPRGKVTALIGPSGCGKSTLLRSVNRMNDLIDNIKITGDMRLNGDSIYHRSVDVIELRKRMGMVFQKPNPFPMSVFENVVYPLPIDGIRDKRILNEVCERSLRGSALWDEVKDRLHESALGMSGGQQQRLCIARAIAAEPEVLLLDEPCSALDPIATGKIEDLIHELKGSYSVLIVTHNMQQASRTSDYTAFMYLGRLLEYGPTRDIFLKPHLKETQDYVTGRFG